MSSTALVFPHYRNEILAAALRFSSSRTAGGRWQVVEEHADFEAGLKWRRLGGPPFPQEFVTLSESMVAVDDYLSDFVLFALLPQEAPEAMIRELLEQAWHVAERESWG